jgi:hypothetical protein
MMQVMPIKGAPASAYGPSSFEWASRKRSYPLIYVCKVIFCSVEIGVLSHHQRVPTISGLTQMTGIGTESPKV